MRSRRMPALFTTMSMRPKWSIASWTIRWASSQLATLPALATALPLPWACSISATTRWAGPESRPSPVTVPPMSLTTTLPPLAAIASAVARPIPPPAPVTTATLPSSIPIDCFLLRKWTWQTLTWAQCDRVPGLSPSGGRIRVKSILVGSGSDDGSACVQRVAIEPGEFLVVGGCVFKLLQGEHVLDAIEAVRGALFDHFHDVVRAAGAIGQDDPRCCRPPFSLVGQQCG